MYDTTVWDWSNFNRTITMDVETNRDLDEDCGEAECSNQVNTVSFVVFSGLSTFFGLFKM